MNRKKKNHFTEKELIILEIYFKAVANRKRMKILSLIQKEPGITVYKITEMLGIQYQTVASHLQKLWRAGLIDKKYRDTDVMHTITHKGEMFLNFAERLLK